jgi:hypothetical protein
MRDRIACGRAVAASIATALGKRPSATADAQGGPALGLAAA